MAFKFPYFKLIQDAKSRLLTQFFLNGMKNCGLPKGQANVQKIPSLDTYIIINYFSSTLCVEKEKKITPLSIVTHPELLTGTIHFEAHARATFNSMGNTLLFCCQSMCFISSLLAIIDEARKSPRYLV